MERLSLYDLLTEADRKRPEPSSEDIERARTKGINRRFKDLHDDASFNFSDIELEKIVVFLHNEDEILKDVSDPYSQRAIPSEDDKKTVKRAIIRHKYWFLHKQTNQIIVEKERLKDAKKNHEVKLDEFNNAIKLQDERSKEKDEERFVPMLERLRQFKLYDPEDNKIRQLANVISNMITETRLGIRSSEKEASKKSIDYYYKYFKLDVEIGPLPDGRTGVVNVSRDPEFEREMRNIRDKDGHIDLMKRLHIEYTPSQIQAAIYDIYNRLGREMITLAKVSEELHASRKLSTDRPKEEINEVEKIREFLSSRKIDVEINDNGMLSDDDRVKLSYDDIRRYMSQDENRRGKLRGWIDFIEILNVIDVESIFSKFSENQDLTDRESESLKVYNFVEELLNVDVYIDNDYRKAILRLEGSGKLTFDAFKTKYKSEFTERRREAKHQLETKEDIVRRIERSRTLARAQKNLSDPKEQKRVEKFQKRAKETADRQKKMRNRGFFGKLRDVIRKNIS